MRFQFGNQANYRHGHASGPTHPPTPEYRAWLGMITRCRRPVHHPSFHNYAGRGITVADVFLGEGGFEHWLAHIGPRPANSPGWKNRKRAEYSQDRIDPDGNYEPGNIRWATASQQSANQRRRTRRDSAAA